MRINAYKIKLAQKFLGMLKKELLQVKYKEPMYLEMYSNGREQGYHLKLMPTNPDVAPWSCSFSELRNGDSLVIFQGRGYLAFDSHNVPSEQVYDRKQVFKQSNMYDAVQYVMGQINIVLAEELAKANQAQEVKA